MKKMTQKVSGFYYENYFYPYIAGGDGAGDGDGGGDGAGDGGDGKGAKGKPSSFSQEQVDQMMASQRKSYEKTSAASDKKFSDLTGEFSTLKESLAAMTKLRSEEDDKNLTATELAEKRVQYEKDQGQKALSASEARNKEVLEKLDKTEKRRVSAERDRELDEALTKMGCNDLKMAKRMFRQQMTHNEEEGTWSFESDKGGVMTVEEGLEADLPDYMRSTKARGGLGGKTPAAKLANSITAKEDEIKSLMVKAKQSGGGNDDLALLHGANRELKALKGQLK